MKKVLFWVVVFSCWTGSVWGQQPLSDNDWAISATVATCYGKSDASITVSFTPSSNVYQPPYIVQLVSPMGGTPKEDITSQSGEPVVFEGLLAVPGIFYQVRIFKIINGTATLITPTPKATVIQQPNEIKVFFDGIVPAKCNGEPSGEFFVYATGGSGVYDFKLLGNEEKDVPANVKIPSGPVKAGTYQVDVDSKGCKGQGSVTITEPPAISATFSGVTHNTVCSNDQNGRFTISASGGTPGIAPNPAYTFILNGVEKTGTSVIFDELAGNHTGGIVYEVLIIDGNGCEKTFFSPAITAPAPTIRFTATPTNPTCNGSNNGRIDITVLSGNARFTLELEDGTVIIPSPPNATFFPNLKAGMYKVVGRNQGGGPITCYYTEIITLVDPPKVTVTVDDPETDITHVKCNGEATGSIKLTATGGSAGSTYQYQITGTSPGASYTGGSWQLSSTFVTLFAGTYKIQARVSTTCLSDIVYDIEITQPDKLVIDVSSTDALCSDSEDGTITVTVIGGTPDIGPGAGIMSRNSIYDYKFSLNGTEVIPDEIDGFDYIFKVGGGNYTIVVTDANGCEKTGTAEVKAPKNIDFEIFPAGDPFFAPCAIEDVTLTANITECEPDRDIVFKLEDDEWDNGNEFVVRHSGSYTYTIQVKYADEIYAHCLVATETKTITFPDPITLTLVNTEPVKCYGGVDGEIEVKVENGTGNYTYTIIGPETTDVETVDAVGGSHTFYVSAGMYSISVVDKGNNNCASPDILNDIEITEPVELKIEIVETTKASCSASTDGTIIFTVSGGTKPYSFTLNGVSRTPGMIDSKFVFQVGGAISNTIEVIDAHCPLPSSVVRTVGVATPIMADILYNPVTCFGQKGILTVNITQRETEKPGWELEVFYMKNNSSHWVSNSGVWISESSYEISNLDAGDYKIKAVYTNDATYSCAWEGAETIVIPDPITLSPLYDTTPVKCNDGVYGDKGSMTVTASGGYSDAKFWFSISKDNAPPVWYEGNDVDNHIYTFTDLLPGEYTITVKKVFNGIDCTASETEKITHTFDNPPALKITNVKITDILCPSLIYNDEGAIEVSTTGGADPLMFTLSKVDNLAFSEIQETGLFEHLTKGTYKVEVEDINGCPGVLIDDLNIDLDHITVNQPEPIVFTAIATETILPCDGETTDITVILDASMELTKEYYYRIYNNDDNAPLSDWLNYISPGPGTFGQQFGKGNYYVLMAYDDGDKCSDHKREEVPIKLSDNRLRFDELNSERDDCPDWHSGTLAFISPFPLEAKYTLWYKKKIDDEYIDLALTPTDFKYTDLSVGYYKIIGSYGKCLPESDETIFLSTPESFSIDVKKILNPCTGSSNNGYIKIEGSGGTPPLSFQLGRTPNGTGTPNTIGSPTGGEFFPLGTGYYSFQVIDNIGCRSGWIPEVGIRLQAAPPLQIKDVDITPVFCVGGTGSATVILAEGTGRIDETTTYKWYKSPDDENVEISLWIESGGLANSPTQALESGWYYAMVTDGCGITSKSKPFQIEDHSLKIVASSFENGIICDGTPAGKMSVTITGGKPDVDGTVSRYSYSIEKDGHPFDPGSNVEISYDSDTDTETYTISGLDDGEYMITVTDAASCNVSHTEEIENPIPLSVANPTVTQTILCFGESGEITVEVSGGTPDYTFVVSDEDLVIGTKTSSSEGLVTIPVSMNGVKAHESKLYTVTVTGSDGCSVSTNINLTNPDELKLVLSLAPSNQPVLEEAYICTSATTGRLYRRLEGGTGNQTIDKLYKNDQLIDDLNSFTFNQTPAGKYYAYAKDGNGCISEQSNTVTLIQYKSLKVDGDPVLTDATCQIMGSIEIVGPSGGDSRYLVPGWEDDPDLDSPPIYEYQVYNKDGIVTGFEYKEYPNHIITGLPAGEYFVMMKHKDMVEKGISETCIPPLRIPQTGFVTIVSQNIINPADTWHEPPVNPSCFYEKDGSIQINTPPIAGEFEYTLTYPDHKKEIWRSSSENKIFNDLFIGKYTLHIRDVGESGCENDFEFDIIMPQVKIENISELKGFDCEHRTGYIEFEVELLNDPANALTVTFTCAGIEKDAEIIAAVDITGGKRWTYRANLNNDGEIIIKAVIGNNCFVEEKTNVTFPQPVKLTYSVPEEVNCTSSNIKVTFNIEDGTAPYTLSITGKADVVVTGKVYQVDLGEGIYTATVVDKIGCSDQVNSLKIELPEQVNLANIINDGEKTLCKNSANGSIHLTTGSYNYKFVWDKDGSDKTFLSNLEAGTYGVTVYNSKGNCPVHTEFEVGIATNIEVTINPPSGMTPGNDGKYLFCADGNVSLSGTILINGVAITQTSGAWANWILSDGSPPKPYWENYPQFVFPATNGTVTLTVTENTCNAEATLEMELRPAPEVAFKDNDIGIPKDDVVDLQVIYPEFQTYSWSTIPAGLQPANPTPPLPPSPVSLTSPDEPYTLILTLTDKNGCTSSASIQVSPAEDFFIPNAFTPASGDENSTWKFRNLDQYTPFYDFHVIVFVRGGAQVFESKEYHNSKAWDGRRNGDDVPIGTYWYVVERVKKSDRSSMKIYKGSVTIIR